MNYQVVFVEDDALPAHQDWALVREPGAFYAFLKESRISPSVLADAWAAFTQFLSEPDVVKALLAEPAVPIRAVPRSA